VKAGLLRERVTFERRALDPNGDRLGAWEAQFTRSAHARPLVGGEAVMAQRLAAKQPYLFAVRACSETATVDPTWRLIWNGAAFNIRAVTLNERRDGYDILADSGGASG
jgi:SPP1 family predicted phage head-tail adaptor